jgi:hypothetical protein
MIKWLLSGIAKVLIGPDPPRDFSADFDTPEGAVLMLERAYQSRDIEAAVACKDFSLEATLLLADKPEEIARDLQVRMKTAEVLELAFRKEVGNAFPDMTGVTSRFLRRYRDGEDFVVVREECTYPDGSRSRQRINVGRTKDGWRVLNAS